jgi:hypothetical protein
VRHDADQPFLFDGHMAAISEHIEWSKTKVWGYIDTVTSGSKVVVNAHDERKQPRMTKKKVGFLGFAFQQSLYRLLHSFIDKSLF